MYFQDKASFIHAFKPQDSTRYITLMKSIKLSRYYNWRLILTLVLIFAKT